MDVIVINIIFIFTFFLVSEEDAMETESVTSNVWKCQGHTDVAMETIPPAHIVNLLLQVSWLHLSFLVLGHKLTLVEHMVHTLKHDFTLWNFWKLFIMKAFCKYLNNLNYIFMITYSCIAEFIWFLLKYFLIGQVLVNW